MRWILGNERKKQEYFIDIVGLRYQGDDVQLDKLNLDKKNKKSGVGKENERKKALKLKLRYNKT